MSRIAAVFFLLLPALALGDGPNRFTLKSTIGGQVYHDISCDKKSGRPCFAVLLKGTAGAGSDGKDVAVGNLLLTGAWTLREAQEDLSYVSIALGAPGRPGLSVALEPVAYASTFVPLSYWSHDAGDIVLIRGARIVISISEAQITQTFGLGTSG